MTRRSGLSGSRLSAGRTGLDWAPRKRTPTKNKPPPTNPPPAATGNHIGLRTTQSDVQRATGGERLRRHDQARPPYRLRLQLSTSTLRARAEALANAGWTEQALAAAVTNREWEGARGGAVITWLTDLANEPRSRPAAREDPRTGTLRRRLERAQARASAAAPDSPARAAARQLTAQLSR